ncbi:MAG: hypothetical protein PHV74_07840 [Dehalococcoidia bacterium]|nr:hypothetical protein [Dehalococcoidia bacterium]
MFDSTSRYYNLETATYTTSDGQVIAYKRRRFLPQGKDLPLLTQSRVEQSDRLDLIAGRTIGDPEQFWRVCDANDAMNPDELIEEPGVSLRVPIPQPEVPR